MGFLKELFRLETRGAVRKLPSYRDMNCEDAMDLYERMYNKSCAVDPPVLAIVACVIGPSLMCVLFASGVAASLGKSIGELMMGFGQIGMYIVAAMLCWLGIKISCVARAWFLVRQHLESQQDSEA